MYDLWFLLAHIIICFTFLCDPFLCDIVGDHHKNFGVRPTFEILFEGLVL